MDGHGSHQTDDFMWECFQNDVFALFLPAHTSHVLQPLDLSVFGALKGIYRREVGNAALEDDTTPYGKEKFLSCYKIARETALVSRTIRNGWQATGLWPVNSAKPLMSPLLLENRNKAPSTPQPGLLTATNTSYSWPSSKPLSTPQKSTDIRALLSDVKGQLAEGSTTARLLFRKTGKSLDIKNMLITSLQAEVAVLRARNADKILKRKRVVVEDPNNRFATIEDIMRTKRQMIAILEESAEEEDQTDTDIEDEIVVAC
jgi:DDE superfamily endonuclease